MNKRKETFDRKRQELNLICQRCRQNSTPSIDRCTDCTTGRKLRMLEVEYSDVTGWSHDHWKKL